MNGDTYGDSEEAQFLNVVMPLWESLHPEITVEAVRQDSSQYHQMIVTSFGTGMSPDVARVDIANIAAYAKQGGLTALSDYPDFAELSASYLDAPLSTNLYQGKYYGLPLDTNCKAAVVNTHVLKELGLDAAKKTILVSGGSRGARSHARRRYGRPHRGRGRDDHSGHWDRMQARLPAGRSPPRPPRR